MVLEKQYGDLTAANPRRERPLWANFKGTNTFKETKLSFFYIFADILPQSDLIRLDPR